jgi:lipoprotein
MGFFDRLFGKKRSAEPVSLVRTDDEEMERAAEKARETFKYFWREYYWEQRRIVKGLSRAAVKAPFSQEIKGVIETEYMWLDDIYFDGVNISGTLINQPNILTIVRKGERITDLPYREITDWLLAYGKKTCGGFGIQALRAQMDEQERRAHDEACGLDFGDGQNVLLAIGQEEHPEYLEQHPADINMSPSLRDYLNKHPAALNEADENGQTMLHHAAIAGNAESVRVILAMGADPQRRDTRGKTAADYVKEIGWPQLVNLFNQPAV